MHDFDGESAADRAWLLGCWGRRVGLRRHPEPDRLLLPLELGLPQALALRKKKLGPDHPDTLMTMRWIARTLVEMDRRDDALKVIDKCLELGAKADVDPRLIPNLRLRRAEIMKDAVGCREAVKDWEKLNRSDASYLYSAACYRAVTAAVMKQDPKIPKADVDQLVKENLDRAMDWLRLAAAKGATELALAKKDKDLDALRDRDDFRNLKDEPAKTKLSAQVEQPQPPGLVPPSRAHAALPRPILRAPACTGHGLVPNFRQVEQPVPGVPLGRTAAVCLPGAAGPTMPADPAGRGQVFRLRASLSRMSCSDDMGSPRASRQSWCS
jgi:hypothetical protein